MRSGPVTLTEWDSEYDALRVVIDPDSGELRYSQVLVMLLSSSCWAPLLLVVMEIVLCVRIKILNLGLGLGLGFGLFMNS